MAILSTKGRIPIGVVGALLWGLTALPGGGVSVSLADTVHFKNGDVITGKLIKISGGDIIFETDHSGELTIDADQVTAVETDRPMTVEYEDGREVEGVLGTSTGSLTVDQGAEAPAEAPEPAEIGTVLDLEGIEEVREITPYYRYVGNLEFGLNISKGNSDNENINLSGLLAPSFGKNTISIDGRWNRGKADGEINASNWRINAQYEREFWKKWFFLLFNSYEYDKLQDLDLRVATGAGLGYKFFEPDPTLLKVSLAPAFVHESFDDTPAGDTPDRDFAALRWRLEFDQDLWSPDVTIYHNHILTAGLTESQLILLTAQGLKFGLIADLALKLEFQWDYNKEPADDADKSDYRYLVKLAYDFGGDENEWLP